MTFIFNIIVKTLNRIKSILEKLVIIFTPMLIKNMLVGFFLVLFSFQLAPIQEVGAFLYINQMMEEIPHGQDDSGMKFQDDTLKQLFFTVAALGENIDMTGYLLSGKTADIYIKSRSSDDIQTPPPNIIA